MPEKVHLDEAPSFAIRDGNVHISMGGAEVACMALRVFRTTNARGTAVLADYDTRKAKVVPLRKRKGPHAA